MKIQMTETTPLPIGGCLVSGRAYEVSDRLGRTLLNQERAVSFTPQPHKESREKRNDACQEFLRDMYDAVKLW